MYTAGLEENEMQELTDSTRIATMDRTLANIVKKKGHVFQRLITLRPFAT
jgi:hypothetical protein